MHDVNFRRFPERGLIARGVEVLVPLAARRSTRVLTDSEASKTDIVELLGIARERVDVAPLGPGIADGVKGPSPLEIRRRFDVGDAPLVLSVLAKRPHKNAGRLIEALARVPEAVLLMPGYSTAHEEELPQAGRAGRGR